MASPQTRPLVLAKSCHVTRKWQRFATVVRMERLWTCEWCLKDHSQAVQQDWLHVHHIEKWRLWPELRFERSNLLVLCQRCHNYAERLPPEIQRWLTAEFDSKGFNFKLMAFSYDKYSTQSTGDKAPLPEGLYTSNPKAKNKAGSSLHIIKKLEAKTLRDGSTTRHSFLIGSDDTHGTAFLKVDVQDYFLTPEACALAFSKKDKDNSDPFQLDPIDAAELDANLLVATQNRITDDANAKVIAANTPEEVRNDAVEKAIRNTLLQIQINVGTIFRLQDWAGVPRDPQGDLGALDKTEFEGAVKASSMATGAPEVSVYSKPKDRAVTKSEATAFKTA